MGDFKSIFRGSSVYTHAGSVAASCVAFTLVQAPSLTANEAAAIDPAMDANLFKGLCAQSLQAQCGQQPQIIYELGTENYYTIAAKPSGSGQLSNVFGPSTETLKGLKDLANICEETKLVVKFLDCGECRDQNTSGTNRKAPSKDVKQTMIFAGGFLTGVTLSAQSNSFLLNGTWSFTFQDFQVDV